MPNAVDALKLAIELEKQALEKYREAIPHVTNEQTRKAASTSQSQHLGFKALLARGANFGHSFMAIGLFSGKVLSCLRCI